MVALVDLQLLPIVPELVVDQAASVAIPEPVKSHCDCDFPLLEAQLLFAPALQGRALPIAVFLAGPLSGE